MISRTITSTITIVGLGPGDVELLTRKAWRVLENAPEVYLRTAVHPGIEELPIRVRHSFDDLYENAENFETLYAQIADRVVELGKRAEGVVYAVPGHPLVGETTVTLILERARAAAIPVTIIDGLSFIEPTLAAIGVDGLRGIQIHDAIDVAAMHHPALNPDQHAILAQVYSHAVASDVKLTLANQYPDDHPVTLIHGAGTPEQELETVPLHDMDQSERIDHLTSLHVPPVARPGSFERFQEIMAHLRAPEGCPWDQKQTHQTLRKYLIEETAEVLEALDNEDIPALTEELGDLMLQIVFHTQIATEDGEFRMIDVLNRIIDKLITRHPHVWGDVQVEGADQVLANWDAIKKQEKADRGEKPRESVLDGIPRTLSALATAHDMQRKAQKVGFDWTQVQDVIATLREEIDELLSAPDDKKLDELGDVLFSVVNVSRWLNVDPEEALRSTNRKFERRFRYVEANAPRPLNELPMAELEALWQDAKRAGN
jgi:tetrapyrrole methylase family protein / MazG family protein